MIGAALTRTSTSPEAGTGSGRSTTVGGWPGVPSSTARTITASCSSGCSTKSYVAEAHGTALVPPPGVGPGPWCS